VKEAVCYIDLLGFSQLTANPDIKNNQKIISRYIKNLHKYIYQAIEKTDIKYCILSDSVFLYIENNLDILLFSLARIFRNCINSGVLLRAGMAYGEYNFIKTNIATNNIYGIAVTKAVLLENKGKGCRIFIDDNLPKESNVMRLNSEIFLPYKNHIDYSEIDIFEWPLFYKDYYVKQFDISKNIKPLYELKDLLNNNCKLLSYLKYSPLFSWNSRSDNGRFHLLATIEYITNITNKMINKLNQFELLPTENILLNEIRKDKTVKNLIEMYKKIFNV
jgi:hypothetical protein